MRHEAFDTRTGQGSDRTGYWERATRRFFGPLGTTNLAEREFDARMLVYHVGPLRLYTIDATAHRVIRDHSEMGEATLALLESTLRAQQDPASEARPLPEALRIRVREYIESNLADSELTVDRIARDLKCSKRYLHRVFEREDTTVERYIWNTRLARCRQALEHGAHLRTSISEVAWRWGFSSTAHFSRRFKAQYGVTPTQFVNAIRC